MQEVRKKSNERGVESTKMKHEGGETRMTFGKRNRVSQVRRHDDKGSHLCVTTTRKGKGNQFQEGGKKD